MNLTPNNERKVFTDNKPSESQSLALPIAVREVLGRLGEEAVTREQQVFLKGGVACFFYAQRALGEAAATLKLRPVSLDIDWTCDASDPTLSKHLEILSAVSGMSVEVTANREEYGPLTFGSTIARGGASASEGIHVELDLIPVCRFIPDSTGFMYEFSADKQKNDSTTPAVDGLPGVRLNSIETVLCEKLGLGRGATMGKFDIVDSALILALGNCSTEAVSRIVDSQEFGFDLERPMTHTARVECVGGALSEIACAIQIASAVSDSLQPSELKQLALIARLLSGLEKTNEEALTTFFTDTTAGDLKNRLNQTLAGNTHALREALVSHAKRIVSRT